MSSSELENTLDTLRSLEASSHQRLLDALERVTLQCRFIASDARDIQAEADSMIIPDGMDELDGQIAKLHEAVREAAEAENMFKATGAAIQAIERATMETVS